MEETYCDSNARFIEHYASSGHWGNHLDVYEYEYTDKEGGYRVTVDQDGGETWGDL